MAGKNGASASDEFVADIAVGIFVVGIIILIFVFFL